MIWQKYDKGRGDELADLDWRGDHAGGAGAFDILYGQSLAGQTRGHDRDDMAKLIHSMAAMNMLAMGISGLGLIIVVIGIVFV